MIYTIGYGNRPIGDFIDLLKRYGVTTLVDTRSIPASRFRPDFRKKALQEHLEGAGLGYLYVGGELGGKKVDPAALEGGKIILERLFALESFQFAIDGLAALARQGQILCLMCAEQKPQNCHRAYMLTPPLLERGFEVLHIDERGELKTQTEVQGWFPADH